MGVFWSGMVGVDEVLRVEDTQLGMYRVGNKRPEWTRALRRSVQAACFTTARVFALTEGGQLASLPRRPFENAYTLALPQRPYRALLLVQENPPRIAALPHSGELLLLAPPEERPTRVPVSQHPLRSGCVAPNQTVLVSDEAGQVWGIQKSQVAFRWEGALGGILAWALHPTQPIVAGAGVDGIIRVWSFPSGKLQVALAGHRFEVLQVLFDKQGDLLLTFGSDAQLLVWRWRESQLPRHYLRLPAPPQNALLHRDAKGELWLLTSSGMHRLDLNKLEWRSIAIQTLTKKEAQQ